MLSLFTSPLIFTKCQLISKVIFHGFPYSKKQTKLFTFFALTSKMGQIKKIQAYHYIKYTLITN